MKKMWATIVILSLLIAAQAQAGEGLFARTYTTETVPEGHWELEQMVRNRSGRAFGEYSAYDFRTEFEYGITDKLQAAFYINYGHIDAKGAPDDDDPNGVTGFSRNRTYLQGFSGEFIYRVLSPVTDPLGLAFYIEPEVEFYDPHNGLKYDQTWSTEYRILLQKNFLGDQLILAYNLVAEVEFIRFDGEDKWSGELDVNNEIGLSYRVKDNWYGGWEARSHTETGDFKNYEHSVYWTGPNVHYADQNYWVTVGVLAQFYGHPNGVDDNGINIGNNLFLRSHEKWEVSAKVGFPF